MITNREIASERLLEEALAEVVASARENDLPEAVVAATLRERAAALESADDEAPRGDEP